MDSNSYLYYNMDSLHIVMGINFVKMLINSSSCSLFIIDLILRTNLIFYRFVFPRLVDTM
uniref:Uncharacterized protein n=1 Tax=Arundo donax TaxID=35708 RepID=A0A0A9EGG5_ARUDO